MKTLVFFSFMLLLFTETISSQVFVNRDVAFSWNRVNDQGMSPLTYSGPGMNVALGASKEWAAYSLAVNTGFGGAMLLTFPADLQNMGMVTATNYVFQADFFYLLPYNFKQIRFYAGANVISDLKFRLNSRLGNSAPSYDGIIGFGPNLKASLPFKYKSKMYLTYFSATMPIFTELFRPNYINLFNYTYPGFDILGEIFENTQTAGPIRHFLFQYEVGVERPLLNGNRVALSYNFTAYKFKTVNTVAAIEQRIGFTTYFNIPEKVNTKVQE